MILVAEGTRNSQNELQEAAKKAVQTGGSIYESDSAKVLKYPR